MKRRLKGVRAYKVANMEPFLLTIGDLVVVFRGKGGKGGRVAAIDFMTLVASFDAESADAFGDAVELLTTALHSGREANIIFLVPAAIVRFNHAMFEFTLY